jgi:ribose/xylose/arabinose/galactoside ABC-type transport system permease subunit
MSDFDSLTRGDERISYRGPVKRLLVSPEIGALIGTIVVWAFFWGNGDTFGTAGSTANFLDVAAPLGIMAIAVSLLMIGGEFDLSSGVITGATGVTIALMAKYFTAGGSPIWVAVAAAFILCGCVGWWNGFLVNRTGLPSFIVTLGTFFVIKGANLVFAKRVNDKVNISDIDGTEGFKLFKAIFAGENVFENWRFRDQTFIIGGLLCGALLIAGLVEQSLVRRTARRAGPLLAALVGILAVAAGVVVLHRTDSVSGNAIAGVVGLLGVVVAIVGWSASRFETKTALTGSLPAKARSLALAGVVGTAVASLAGHVFSRDERLEVRPWLPGWLVWVFAIAGALYPVVNVVRDLRSQEVQRSGGAITWMILRLPVISLVTLTLVVSVLQLTTVQAVRAVVITLAGVAAAVCFYRARSLAGKVSTTWFRNIGVIMGVAFLMVAFALRADSSASRFRGGIFSVLLISGALVIASTLVEARHVQRKKFDPASDQIGRRLVVAGGIIGFVSLGQRLLFSDGVFRMSIFWWLFFTIVGSFVLTKTKYGNWIFAVGGNKDAARAVGVPADKVKTSLFMATSLMGCFVGTMILMRLNSVQAQQGDGQEFEFIIAAVVGGNLMTGGYGSVIGASLGALIMAISKNGIPAARWNQDGRFIFLGVVLLVAVLVNNYVRKKANEQR